MGDFMTRTRTLRIKRALFSSAAVLASLMVAEPAAAAAAAAAAQPVPPPASQRPDRHHRHPPDRPHRHQLGLADRRHRLDRADQPADRQPARHGQEHRPVLLRPAEQHFGRVDLRSRAVAARPVRPTKCWSRSTASASTARRWSRSMSAATPALAFGSQGADISAIPSIAIKNLQVLRDGATAQYGSDAIAGVMNFGMRNDRNNLELQARYGQYFRPWPHQARQRQEPADRRHRGYRHRRDRLHRRRRRMVQGRRHQHRRNPPGCAHLRAGIPGPRAAAAQLSAAGADLGLVAARMAGRAWSTPASTSPSNSQLYFTGIGAYNNANESFNYRSPITARPRSMSPATPIHLGANGAFSAPFFLTPCPAGSATCPAGGYVHDDNTFLFTDLYPAGFTPRFVGITKERWGTAGWRGELDGGLTWDLSGTLAKNTLTLSMYNSLSPTYGPDIADQLRVRHAQPEGAQRQPRLHLSDRRRPCSPLTLAWGAEYRKEIYGQSRGRPAVLWRRSVREPAGAVRRGFAGRLRPHALCRRVILRRAGSRGGSRSVDVRHPGPRARRERLRRHQPDLCGQLEPVELGRLRRRRSRHHRCSSAWALAGRYEHYNTFGGSFVYKLNGIYKVTPQFSVRGTIGTGFHAPSPGQAHDAILTTNFVAGNQVQTGTYPVDSPISQFYRRDDAEA